MLELQDTLCQWIWQRVVQPSLLPHVRTARLPHAVAHSASHLPPCAVQAVASSDLKGACIEVRMAARPSHARAKPCLVPRTPSHGRCVPATPVVNGNGCGHGCQNEQRYHRGAAIE
jgi:hypothetical protein